MSIKNYQYSKLNSDEIRKISSLEKDLNKSKNGENKMVLIAFSQNN